MSILLTQYQNNKPTGLNGKLGDWFRRNKSKIFQVVVATVTLGPAGFVAAMTAIATKELTTLVMGKVGSDGELPMSAQEETFLENWVETKLKPYVQNIATEINFITSTPDVNNAFKLSEIQAKLCVLKIVATAPTPSLSANAIANRKLLVDSFVEELEEVLKATTASYIKETTVIHTDSNIYNSAAFNLLGLPKPQGTIGCTKFMIQGKSGGVTKSEFVSNDVLQVNNGINNGNNNGLPSTGNNQPESSSMMKPLLILGAIIGGFFLFKKKK